MGFPRLDERSDNVVLAKQASATQVSATGSTSVELGTFSFAVPAKPPAGYAIRVTMAGTKTGTAATHSITLSLNGTAAILLTAGNTGQVQWMAQAVILFAGVASQKSMGLMMQHGVVSGAKYQASTVNVSEGARLTAKVGLNASDTVTVEMFTIEAFVADIV